MTDSTNETTVRFSVNKENKATLVCRKCGASRTVDVSKVGYRPNGLKVTCKCGASFRGIFDYRNKFRKKVNLRGTYLHLNKKWKDTIIVKDISNGGVGFECMDAPRFSVGDIMELTFTLDNPRKTELRIDVKVRRIKKHFIGSEIANFYGYQADIGFYVLGNSMN